MQQLKRIDGDLFASIQENDQNIQFKYIKEDEEQYT